MLRLFAIFLSTFALSACSVFSTNSTDTTVGNFYDYQLYSPEKQSISLQKLPREILDADVVLIGEWHTHSGIHRFQTELLEQLAANNDVALSMEQFSRDKQANVDSYLAGETGEQVLIKSGNAWPNYESDYRPLIELAKQHNLDIIAANAPKPIVRCIGREGISYLDKLDGQQRALLAQEIDTSASPYKDKFMASMHHGEPEQTEKQFAAQITWDETMAESITRYLDTNPSTQVVHIAGKFHIEQGLGTKASILKRNPNLNVVVISPYADLSGANNGQDFVLHVLAPPTRYVKMENRMAAYQHLTSRNNTLECK